MGKNKELLKKALAEVAAAAKEAADSTVRERVHGRRILVTFGRKRRASRRS